MKIAHVLPALTKGGAERVAVDLANAAVLDGNEVSMVLAYPVDAALLQVDLAPTVKLHFVRESKQSFGAYSSLPAWLWRNSTWLMGQDIIHCHLTFGSVFGSIVQLMRWPSNRHKPKVVETYHAVGMGIPRWKRFFDSQVLSGRDQVALMALDPYWKAFIATQGGTKVRVIPNGVSPVAIADKEDCRAFRVAAGIPPDALLVGSIGRLRSERRPDALFDAFATVASDLPDNVHLLLAGEGPERDRLRVRADQLGLGHRVHLPGLARNPAEVFPLFDLFLTVNVGSITGIAALEAAIAGIPVMAFQMNSDHDGSADWIWSSNDVAQLGTRISSLMGDKRARRRLAAAQCNHARENHDAEKMSQAYLRLYREVLQRRERAG